MSELSHFSGNVFFGIALLPVWSRNKILVSAGHEKTMLRWLNLLIGYKLIS